MSIITIDPGGLVEFDPSDVRVIVFDWDKTNLGSGVQISSQTVTITRITGSGNLTKDNEALMTGAEATTALGRTITVDNRASRVRIDATAGVVGDRYMIADKIVTTETPAQTKEQSFQILVENR